MSLLNIKGIKKLSKNKESLIDIIKEEKNTVKFTVNIPESLHRSFKTQASSEGRQMSDIVLSLLISYLKSKNKAAK
jgi:hypothetical protein